MANRAKTVWLFARRDEIVLFRQVCFLEQEFGSDYSPLRHGVRRVRELTTKIAKDTKVG
jgi:hypothetical protein